MQQDKVLITGAHGFVGKALCAELSKRGILYKPVVRHSVVGDEVVVHDIDQRTEWAKALQDCSIIIHLAARAHVLKDIAANALEEFRKINLYATIHLAKSAAKSGVRRFVYVSSIGVNGAFTEEGEALSEESLPKPHSDYALSKWEAECALHQIASETGLEVVIVRPPLVYGPDAPGNFGLMINIIRRGLPLPLGAVRNSRSLIYIGNLVTALIACMTHPAAVGNIYLVSDGEDISTPKLIETIAAGLGRPYRNFPLPVSLVRICGKLLGKSTAIDSLTQSLVINSSKIRDELNWQPFYTLADGLSSTLAWYRQSTTEE